MPSQQVEIAEAIAGIKRALKREREVPSDQPAIAASNRGNKLKRGAKYVHEGSLTSASGPEVYKEKIEHAGYTRYILDRNPRRYNEYGEELEDSETDQEADADAADQNAYSGIRLEELLCPLKHPSELPVHPTMSHAYLSSALPDMVLSTHEKLRQERANLWRAKYLNRQLTGDALWIPAGDVESAKDWELFEPRPQGLHRPSSRKRKRVLEERKGENGVLHTSSEARPETSNEDRGYAVLQQGATPTNVNGAHFFAYSVEETRFPIDARAKDVGMENGAQAAAVAQSGNPAPAGVDTNDVVVENCVEVELSRQPNGVDTPPPTEGSSNHPGAQDHNPLEKEGTGTAGHHDAQHVPTEHGSDQIKGATVEEGDASPAPPPRRITRALAANNVSNTHSNAPTPPLSPLSSNSTRSSSSQLQIDPLYLVPQSANPSKSAATFHGLPPEEALETRRMLTLYIQKQEEGVRGYESILSKLLKAQRLSAEVLEMCRMEEHVGELSDGEDWIDCERWGLQPGELRKGRDEDDDVIEENTIGGRKGKRRARN